MVPLTFHYSWSKLAERERLTVMNEFAVNGAKHLVLGDNLLKMMGQDYKLAAVLREQTAQAGVDFVDAHAPFRDFGDLFIPDERDHREMIARQKLNLLLVSEMGVDTCTFHVGSKYYPDHSLDEHREALFRSLDELLPLAEELAITICLENLVRPLSTADDLISYMKKYASPHLGVCLDVGHANLKEQGVLHPDSDVIPAWEIAGLQVCWEKNIPERLQPYIVNCHVHDNGGVGDDHDLPGTGTIDWKRTVPILLNAPRIKSIQSEVLCARRNTPIRTVAENIHALFGYTPEL
jgi:sugar phosphate isomerase/epimerase